MKHTASVTLLILLIDLISNVSSFASINGNTIRLSKSKESSTTFTSLYGTIRFSGTANAKIDTPEIVTNTDEDEDKSLSKFLTSSASDAVLLGTKKGAKGVSQCTKMNDNQTIQGDLWECKQNSIAWFGLTITPIFTNRIEKSEADRNVVISIIDAQTEVSEGSRLGNTLASAMKRSKFAGRNVISWKEGGNNNSGSRSHTLEGDLNLTLTINLPPFLPLPPGFNTIGSKIVERTCRDRLRQNLSDISDAYLVWATTPE